jgi:stearoyl-CoA desaturase (delta-9 desaturase)
VNLVDTRIPTDVKLPNKRIDVIGSLPFILVHVATIAALIRYGWSTKGFLLAVALYYVRMFFVTGVYHRYFSHRTYKTSRVMQAILAVCAMTSFQKGILWWAAHHRTHHKLSDKPGDLHSMKRDGFLWSHVLWILSDGMQETDYDGVRDLTKYPELVVLNKFQWVVPLVYTAILYAAGGFFGVMWGVGVSTVLLWHGTFTINSLSHWLGRRRYNTGDESRNSLILALVTLGEGWHNNHHFYQRATNQGFFWWEIDITFYVLKVMSWLGLIWDLHAPPDRVKYAHLRPTERMVERARRAVPDVTPAVIVTAEADAE